MHCQFGTVGMESKLIVAVGLASAYIFSSRKSDVGTFKLDLRGAGRVHTGFTR